MPVFLHLYPIAVEMAVLITISILLNAKVASSIALWCVKFKNLPIVTHFSLKTDFSV